MAVLIALHIVLGLLLAWCSADQPAFSSGLFIAAIFTQTTLVALWSALGPQNWLLRLIGLAAGTTYLAVLLGLGIGELEGEVIVLVFVATLPVAFILWVVRLTRGRILPRLGGAVARARPSSAPADPWDTDSIDRAAVESRPTGGAAGPADPMLSDSTTSGPKLSDPAPSDPIDSGPTGDAAGDADFADPAEALQFTVRHMLILMLLVACLATLGRFLGPRLGRLSQLGDISALGICFAAVAVASVWAMLGSGRPLFRVLPVALIAATAGWIAGTVIGGRSDQGFWLFVTLGQAALLLVSLLSVRHLGYRLVAAQRKAVQPCPPVEKGPVD